MGWTRLKCMGWAKPGPTTRAPCEQCPPLFTCYVNCGGMAGTKQERKKGRKVDLRWLQPLAVLLQATGGGAGGSRWPAVLFFFSVSLLCFSFSSPLLFFFFRPSPSLFSSFSSFLCPLFSVPPHFFRALPCIYRKNRGDRGKGRPLCNRPKNCPGNTTPSSPTRGKLRASGVGRSIFERELVVENRGRKKSSSSPASRVQGKKKGYSAVQNGTVLVSFFFFFLTVHETRRFGQNTSFHLKGKGGKNVSVFTLVLNL